MMIVCFKKFHLHAFCTFIVRSQNEFICKIFLRFIVDWAGGPGLGDRGDGAGQDVPLGVRGRRRDRQHNDTY